MPDLNGEQWRALRLLARRLDGCAEAVLLAEGFTVGQLAVLVVNGLAETKLTAVGGRQQVWIRITAEGRKAVAEK
jgi:hypothetical protein